jgi:hypothetical protein
MPRLGIHLTSTPRHLRPRTAISLGVLALALTGCAGDAGVHHLSDRRGRLTFGDRGPSVGTAALAACGRLARRFADAYARVAYLRRPPSLPGESPAVARTLRTAALLVPSVRRHLQPRLVGLRIYPLAPGFVLRRRGGRWLITTISIPN